MSLKFTTWMAEKGGPTEVAKLLGVPRETVYAWQQKRSTPRVTTMIKIVRLTQGEISFADIIEATHNEKTETPDAK